jgi:hypothetical protein
MRICKYCKHMRRGEAIDQRPIADAKYRSQLLAVGILPPSLLRPTRADGDYICAKHPITPGRVDPQSGRQSPQRGLDCRDLNPDGECVSFERSFFRWLVQ